MIWVRVDETTGGEFGRAYTIECHTALQHPYISRIPHDALPPLVRFQSSSPRKPLDLKTVTVTEFITREREENGNTVMENTYPTNTLDPLVRHNVTLKSWLSNGHVLSPPNGLHENS